MRPRLFGIAYRMLGSAAEAEDIVQDVWVRWQTADRSVVRGCRGIPRDDDDTTGDQRHAVGTLAPRDVRRTLAAGTSRHERRPLVGSGTRRGVGSLGVSLLLEKLSPTERAAYILREAFDYAYRDIANILRLEEANARQVVTRARQHVVNGPKAAGSTEHNTTSRAFIAAAHNGDVASLAGPVASSGRQRPVAWSQVGARSVMAYTLQSESNQRQKGTSIMKLVIIGGTGLIGSKLVTRLREHGHEAVAASPDTGVNTLTGEGLAEALQGASVVVDVSNSPSFEETAVMEFFTTSTRNLLKYAAAAGVRHYVALSVVGTERIPDSPYLRAKNAQETLIKGAGIPYSIVHATQFFEFVKRIADEATDGTTVRLPPVLIQPMAADDVAKAVGRIAVGAPVNGTIEVAGPQQFRFDELIRQGLGARNDPREVVVDPHARYFGAELGERSLDSCRRRATRRDPLPGVAESARPPALRAECLVAAGPASRAISSPRAPSRGCRRRSRRAPCAQRC